MAECPLFCFPHPERASRSNKNGRGTKYHLPCHDRQVERLSPKFAQLQKAFEQRQIEIQQSAIGIEPEQVLVIETIGNIENFFNAARLIEGFEELGEFEIDEITPDDDFHGEKNAKDKSLNGRYT